MSSLDRGSFGPLAGVAAGGALLAHVAAYALVFADAAERRAHLAGTGHGAFAPLAVLALAAAGVALVAMGVRAWHDDRPASGLRTAGRLAGMQLAIFALLEVAERGFDLTAAAGDPAVRLGVALQFVVAALLAVVLGLFVRAVRLVAAALRSARRRRCDPIGPAAPSRVPSARARWASVSRRGPPLPLPS